MKSLVDPTDTGVTSCGAVSGRQNEDAGEHPLQFQGIVAEMAALLACHDTRRSVPRLPFHNAPPGDCFCKSCARREKTGGDKPVPYNKFCRGGIYPLPWVLEFCKRLSFQRASEDGLSNIPLRDSNNRCPVTPEQAFMGTGRTLRGARCDRRQSGRFAKVTSFTRRSSARLSSRCLSHVLGVITRCLAGENALAHGLQPQSG